MKKILFCLIFFAGASSLRAAEERKKNSFDEIPLDDKEHNIGDVVNILGAGLNQRDREKVIKDVRAIKKSLTHLKETITTGAKVPDAEATSRVATVLTNALIDRAIDDAIASRCCGLLNRKRK
ncbi:hypothetical protein HRU45_01840 [Candidatus Dependentiae bacterium]|nr:hypothetical protein [Candidatus Dependentiae bacterium]